MKINIIKKAESKKTVIAQCPWVIEDYAADKRQ